MKLFYFFYRIVDEECFPYKARVTKCPFRKNGNLIEDGCRIPVKQRTSRYKVAPPGRLINERDIMYDIMDSGPVQGKLSLSYKKKLLFRYRNVLVVLFRNTVSSKDICKKNCSQIS